MDGYRLKAKKELIARLSDSQYHSFSEKSFHLDTYCFDSGPENSMFQTLLRDERLEKVWFTGMFTHGQSEFVIHYIDPESHTLRSYYPDFLLQLKGEREEKEYIILEVKGDNKIDDLVVQAKAEYARQIAGASGMRYIMIAGSKAANGERLDLVI